MRNWEVYNSLEADQQREIDRLCANLKARDYTLDELNAMIYAIPLDVRQADVGDKEKKKLQTTFFKNVYRLLLGREQGPRLYLFLDTLSKDDYLNLLDFSYPQTQQEIDAELKSNAPDEPEVEEQAVEYGDPDPVQDFKPVISLEQFNAIDLRVCKILKCQEIRKARVQL